MEKFRGSKKGKDFKYWLRISLIVGFLLLMTLILPRSFRLNFQHEVGKPWHREELTAPFDFSIYKSTDSIKAEQERAAAQVLPIFVRDTLLENLAKTRIQNRMETFTRQYIRYDEAIKQKDTATVSRLYTSYFSKEFSNLTQENVKKLYGIDAYFDDVIREVERIFNKGYFGGLAKDSLTEFIAIRDLPGKERYVPVLNIYTELAKVRTDLYSGISNGNPAQTQVLFSMLIKDIKPNYLYRRGLTIKERQQQRERVLPVYDKIKYGEKIISKDEIVDKRIDAIIDSLIREQEFQYGKENNWWTFFSQLLIVWLITEVMLMYLRLNRPRIYFSNAKLSLILFILLIVVGGMVVATKLTYIAEKLTDIIGPNLNLSYIYLAPACIVPIFMSNFFGSRIGFLSNLLIALYGAVLIQQGLEYAFVQILAGTVAIFSLQRLKKREVFFYTLALIFLSYSVGYIAFNLYSKNGFININYNTLLLFGINVGITIIAYNLIYLLEQLFGVTSDLTYLELLDTNHPLLKELARKAPGTFQHSLQVAAIAEATINEIGGNSLLTHVGALYHDVGKMAHPNFFIENLSEGEKMENPHNKISCEESANIIIGHVNNGVDMAFKYHLPQEIVKFIKTHHGTTRVEFFYRKYLDEQNCKAPEFEDKFRYAGPLPNSKETAVLMIADSMEAASRSMKNPTPEKLEKLVNNIIDYKINDNQLENSNLTFKDIATIRKVITRQLLSIFHARIEYPKEVNESV